MSKPQSGPVQPSSEGSGDHHYLVGLELTGRKVVIVGAGSVVQRRLPTLADSGADIHVIAPVATPTVESFPNITLYTRGYRDGDLEGAWYALACTDDAEVNAAVVAEAESRRIFCVRADDARYGTAVTPASLSHDRLRIRVLAAGDHRRSAAVRTAIGQALGGENWELRVSKPPRVNPTHRASRWSAVVRVTLI